MKSTFAFAAVVLITGLLLAACSPPPLRVPAPLAEARQFLQAVPAYQIKSTMENRQSHHLSTETMEVVRGGALHHREETDGKMGMDLITDGKREFLLDELGHYEEEHGDAAATLRTETKTASLEWILESASQVELTRHDGVQGTGTLLYTLKGGQGTAMPMIFRVRITDSDHRPLKVEQEWRAANARHPDGVVMQTTDTEFSYDPGVRVALPMP